jgi:hypothetical protein
LPGSVVTLLGMQNRGRRAQYEAIHATELFCPRCRRAVRVREKLLLVLPDGNLYDYLCTECGESLGKRDEEVPGNFARQSTVAPPGNPRRR